MTLDPRPLLQGLVEQAGNNPLCLAYSGGVDSHVLLHLLARAGSALPPLRAVHVDHGLHPESAAWSEHCARQGEALGIAVQIVKVEVSDRDTLGIEAAARRARYQALRAQLRDAEILMTAQHRQDQAETLLLQLLRGAGPAGLSAMRPRAQLFGMTVLRPLLGVDRQQILDYAVRHRLQWIDDPSNADTGYNRNYLRHEVWPLLQRRWPAAATTLARSADHCAEARQLLDELAGQDHDEVTAGQDVLSVTKLLQLNPARQRNLLRHVIEHRDLPIPSARVLQRILDEVCTAAQDRMPRVDWPGVTVRRYRDALYIEPGREAPPPPGEMRVRGDAGLDLGDGRVLGWQAAQGQGLKTALVAAGLTLRFRCGGERIRLAGRQGHHALKQLFQEWGVPPWQRDRVPLLYAGTALVAVVGYALSADHVADDGEPGLIPVLRQR